MASMLHRAGPIACLLAAALIAGAATAGPKIQAVESPGGIKAWLVSDHNVPVVSLRFTMRGGGALDPAGKKGLAGMVDSLLDEGAGELDSQAFQTRLEDLAISLSFSSDADSFGGRFATLSEHRDAAFNMLRLALNEARFDPEAVERMRRQIITGLIRSRENTGRIARRTWFKAAFPEHPYGEPHAGTVESVKAIAIADLKAFVRDRFNRESLIIGVVGDITAAQLSALLDDTFGGLPARPEGTKLAAVVPRGGGQIKVVRKTVPQSRIIFGARGIQRDDPDWYAAYVMNYIVGGGDQGTRLMDEVREKRGLAYSVYSYLSIFDHSALYMGGAGTRNAQVQKSLDTIRDVLAGARDKGVTAKELASAKTYLNGSFPLTLTSGGRIASLLVAMQRHKLGLDYLERRAGLINAVTLHDVARVAARLLRPENLLIVVVGDPELDADKP